MDYVAKGLSLGKGKYGDDLKVLTHLGDDTFELITMATPELERVGDGFDYPVFCVNKVTGTEILSDGILGVFENSDFADLTPNKLSAR